MGVAETASKTWLGVPLRTLFLSLVMKHWVRHVVYLLTERAVNSTILYIHSGMNPRPPPPPQLVLVLTTPCSYYIIPV